MSHYQVKEALINELGNNLSLRYGKFSLLANSPYYTVNLATCCKVDYPSSPENKENSGILYPLDKESLYLLPLDMTYRIMGSEPV